MINPKDNPIGWDSFLYELSDAHEHLGDLLKELSANTECDEVELRIALGHVYAHLNRAWFRRNVPDDFPESEREMASQFPTYVPPVG